MTGATDDAGMSRRHIMAASMIGTLAGAAGLTGTAGAARANDSMKGLTMPVPPQAPMTEGTADLGNTKLWYWDTGGTGEAVVFLHPGSGSGEFYPYQQPAFAKAGDSIGVYETLGGSESTGWKAHVTRGGLALRVEREGLFDLLADHIDLLQGLFSAMQRRQQMVAAQT